MNGSPRTGQLHGATFETYFALPCLPADPHAQVEVSFVEPALAGRPPWEELSEQDRRSAWLGGPTLSSCAELFWDGELSVVQSTSGQIVARYPGHGLDFRFEGGPVGTAGLTIRVEARYSDWMHWIPILAPGSIATVALSLAGRRALHANTVDLFGSGIGIAGRSGSGKTVATALLATRGHTVVADDVTAPTNLMVRPGLLELRVRTLDDPLGSRLVRSMSDLAGASTRVTADGRVAVQPERIPEAGGVPLRAIVFPIREQSSVRPTIEPVGPMDRVQLLLGVMRLEGWIDRAQVRADFEFAVDLASTIPVARLLLPDLNNLHDSELREAAARTEALLSGFASG